MVTDGELGLKYRLDPSTGRITLFGADLGGPIYRVYDRATGALLNTLVIPPSRFIDIGDIIDEKDFPTRTFSPIRFTIDNEEYTGIVVESAGAQQEIISKSELPVATTGTTPAPSLGTTMPPTYDSPAVTNGIVTTPAPLLGTTIPPFPWQKPRDFGIAWPTTPRPCDCIPGTIYLPDRAKFSSDGTIGGISDEDWNRFPPILWIPEGWGISLEDPREFPDYRPECWKEYIKGWEEFAPPGTGGIGIPGVAPTPQELEQLRYPPPPGNAFLGETRIYCRTDKIPSSSREEFSDPKGPWKCLPHEEEENPLDRVPEEIAARDFQERLRRMGPPDELTDEDIINDVGAGLVDAEWERQAQESAVEELKRDQELWDKMPEAQRDGWREWQARENERLGQEADIDYEQNRIENDLRRRVGLPPIGQTWEDMDRIFPGDELSEFLPPAGVPRREERMDPEDFGGGFGSSIDEEAQKIREDARDRLKPKRDEFAEKWGYDDHVDESFVPSSDVWAPPGWGWSPDRGWHQGNPDPYEAQLRRDIEQEREEEKKRKKERDDAWEEQGFDTDWEESEDSWLGPTRIINGEEWYFNRNDREWRRAAPERELIDDPFE